MECPKCHAEVNRQSQFCWQCGATLAAAGTQPAAPAPTPAVPPVSEGQPRAGAAGRGRGKWPAIVAGAAILAGLFLALMLRGGMGQKVVGTTPTGDGQLAGPVTAGTPGSTGLAPANPVTAGTPGNNTPGALVTATPPGNVATGQMVTATPPGNTTAGQALPATTVPATNPEREDIAAYLRKLEAIQNRDAQNPMAQLTALAGAGLNAFAAGMRDLEADGGPETKGSQGPDYDRVFTDLLTAKQGLVRDFRAITPVPQPCQGLHRAYGTYLDTQARAIATLRDSMKAGNPAAPLGALPAGKAAETAQSLANAEEQQIRQRYGIARTTSLVP